MGFKRVLIHIRGIPEDKLQTVLNAISERYVIHSIDIRYKRGYHSER
jgi:hypothetical protein